MLSSSTEYFEALKQEQYLLFLNWPIFVAEKYASADKLLSADSLMDCLIYEWLNSQQIPRVYDNIIELYALYQSQPSILQIGQLEFSLMSIVTALFVSQALCSTSTNLASITQDSQSLSVLTAKLDSITDNYGMERLNKDTAELQEIFMSKVNLVTNTRLQILSKTFLKILHPLTIVDDYIKRLLSQFKKTERNPLLEDRLICAQSLSAYLHEQYQLTDYVQSQINLFVTEIRDKQPEPVEEAYLNELMPLTFTKKVSMLLSNFNGQFFSMFKNGSQEVELIDFKKRHG